MNSPHHVQVDKSVIIVVRPGTRLAGDRLDQACGGSDVLERAVATVAQQRRTLGPFPAASEQQEVEIAVVVVVGVGRVGGPDLVSQTGRLRQILEGAVSTVEEEPRSPLRVEVGGEYIKQAIAVEIIDNAAARSCSALDVESYPVLRRSRNRPTSILERNGSRGIRYRPGTFSGYSPRVMYATFRSQRTPMSSGRFSR